MKSYELKVTYVVPKSGIIYYDTIGPVFGKKATNEAVILYLRKRNTMAVKTVEVTP